MRLHPPAHRCVLLEWTSMLCLVCTWVSDWAGGLRKVGDWVIVSEAGTQEKGCQEP